MRNIPDIISRAESVTTTTSVAYRHVLCLFLAEELPTTLRLIVHVLVKTLLTGGVAAFTVSTVTILGIAIAFPFHAFHCETWSWDSSLR